MSTSRVKRPSPRFARSVATILTAIVHALVDDDEQGHGLITALDAMAAPMLALRDDLGPDSGPSVVQLTSLFRNWSGLVRAGQLTCDQAVVALGVYLGFTTRDMELGLRDMERGLRTTVRRSGKRG
jgi:hypothetical protein